MSCARTTTRAALGGTFAQDDFRIDDDELHVVGIDHGESFAPSYLRCRKPNALRCVHRIEHVVYEAP